MNNANTIQMHNKMIHAQTIPANALHLAKKAIREYRLPRGYELNVVAYIGDKCYGIGNSPDWGGWIGAAKSDAINTLNKMYDDGYAPEDISIVTERSNFKWRKIIIKMRKAA